VLISEDANYEDDFLGCQIFKRKKFSFQIRYI